MSFFGGIGEGLAALGNGAMNTISSLGTGIGDFIGLDGQFGLGGANKAFSLGNIGDAFGSAFDIGEDVVKPNNYVNADGWGGFGAAQQMADNPTGSALMSGTSPATSSLGGTKLMDMTGDQFKSIMNPKTAGLAGLSLKDGMQIGGNIYSTLTKAKIAKQQAADSHALTNNYFERQLRGDKKEDEYTKLIHDAYQNAYEPKTGVSNG